MADDLLAAYDDQLRGDSELAQAVRKERHGPLWWAMFDAESGFVTYRSLDGLDGPALDALIEATVEHFAAQPRIARVEWKTRGHDLPEDLADRLIAHGFAAEEPETVMIGEVSALIEERPLPAGVTVRSITAVEDVQRMIDMQAQVFEGPHPARAAEVSRRIVEGFGEIEAWVAEADGEVICTGRIELVPGTAFAGLYGGATRADWRNRGVYRALTAARARSAAAKGVQLLHSDCTEYSRPILQRSGLAPVTTTTPYVWTRDQA